MQEGTQKSDTTHATVALLIDVDNISPKHADALFKKAASYGNIIVRRAYGQGVPNFPWPKEVILAYAIEPVMRFVSIPGKKHLGYCTGDWCNGFNESQDRRQDLYSQR